jgi:hypothetical protein
MAEINFNNLYDQLSPMDKMFYDQQFQKSYNPNQENIMLSSQNAYEQMKSVYDAQQQVPEKSFFDSLNPFTSASAAEMPTVPNLSLGYNMPTFNLGTGITNTTAATNMFSPFMDNRETVNQDLIQQLIEENQAKRNLFARPNMLDIAGGITQTTPSNINLEKLNSLGFGTNYGVANTPDVIGDLTGSDVYESDDGRPYYIDSKGNKILAPGTVEAYKKQSGYYGKEPSGIENLLKFLIPGRGLGSFLSGILPKESPEVRATKDFYARNFGVNTAGSVGSGIMQGYNPVSGGFLNYITGGRYGEPMQVGLGRAMQGRIENILGRKAPQTDASRAKVEELRNLQLQEMRDRAAGGESLGSIGKSTFSGKGGAFEKKSGGSSGKKGTSSERNYGGR